MREHLPERRDPMSDIDKVEQAEIVERAIEQWMDKKFSAFGKWTLTGVSAAAFGWLCIFLYSHGWKP